MGNSSTKILTYSILQEKILQVKCCIGNLAAKVIDKRSIGSDDAECQMYRLKYAVVALKALCKYIPNGTVIDGVATDYDPCLSRKEAEKILEQLYKICGGCLCDHVKEDASVLGTDPADNPYVSEDVAGAEYILQENGDYLLQENGDRILL